jgi:hypothetical protein
LPTNGSACGSTINSTDDLSRYRQDGRSRARGEFSEVIEEALHRFRVDIACGQRFGELPIRKTRELWAHDLTQAVEL